MSSQESIVKYVVKSPIMTQGMPFLRDCLSYRKSIKLLK